MLTLYVSDLDGTLLNEKSRISDESASIISDLSRSGALITVATARTPATVEPLLSQTYTSIPAIVMTGAALWDREAKRYVEPKFIDSAAVESIRQTAGAYGISPFVYTLGDDGILNVFKDSPLSDFDRRFIAERSDLRLKHFFIDSGVDATAEGRRVILLFASGPKDVIAAVANELRGRVACSPGSYLDIFDPSTGCLDVYAPGTDKAKAVKRLAEKTGAERIVVFGDNLNDIPMMRVADVAVAVDNALPEVKAVADKIIGPNTSDSVPRFISEDYRKNCNNPG